MFEKKYDIAIPMSLGTGHATFSNSCLMYGVKRRFQKYFSCIAAASAPAHVFLEFFSPVYSAQYSKTPLLRPPLVILKFGRISGVV